MKRLIAASLFALLGACTTGSVGDDVQGDDTTPQDEITCMAEVNLVGTFVIGDPQPAEISGCWPVGLWTYAPTVVTNTCANPPQLLASYAFRGTRDLTAPDPNYAFDYQVTSPAADPTAHVSVTSGGSGECSGSMMVYSADGLSVANLHPALNADTSIAGNGTFEVHTMDQRPEPQ